MISASFASRKRCVISSIIFGGPWEDYYDIDENSLHNGKMRNTELSLELEYSPGRLYTNSKQGRILINRDATVFTLSHTLGIKGFMGGQYSYNVTEAGIYRRFWLNSWGRMTWNFKMGYQWDQVPYPLRTLARSEGFRPASLIA